jgi:anti-sigma regulatory factor (Ser/Thr protein kinase)
MSTTILLEKKQPPTGPRTAQRPLPPSQPIAAHHRTPAPSPHPGSRPSHERQAVLALPAEIRWVPAARHCVAGVLAHWGFWATDRESAELVVGELAANAAKHGHRDMTVRLSLHTGLLRISVTDSGARARRRPPRDTDPDEHGRGLAIVEVLAQEVRVSQGSRGRRVDVVLGTTAADG